ncbi:MAG: DUF1351 domain-containing protein [Sporomusaceae bacterium]|nr:DUF1351 domain-containing protein [Sporomusaceae bacterium]
MELQVIKEVHDFEWNFAEIKANVQEYIAKYHGLVVTEENLKEMEVAQKEIAGVRTKIDGFRKEVKKRLEIPYKQFEAQVKELQALVEEAERPLKEQILQYENERVCKAESDLLDFAEKTAYNLGLRPEYVGRFAIQSKWTNRSARLSSSKKEIVQVLDELLSQQNAYDEAEKLKVQRADLIASLCEVHSQSTGLKTPVTPEDVEQLLTDTPLPEITNVIIQACHDRKNIEARAAATEMISDLPVAPPISVSCDPPLPPMDLLPGVIEVSVMTSPVPEFIPTAIPPMPPVMPPRWDVVLSLPGITIMQAQMFKGFLAEHGIIYTVINQTQRSDS